MLHIRHVGNRYLTWSSATSLDRWLSHLLRPGLGQFLPPRPTYPHSDSQSNTRNLHFAPTIPITIRDRDLITFHLKNGTSLEQKFSPTPKAKLPQLKQALIELLRTPDLPSSVIEPLEVALEKGDTGLSFGAGEWYLDPEGDAIHRHIVLASAEELDSVQTLIMQRADELGHHPHITCGKNEDSEDMLMTITCTTHSPRGLSVRDTRLARAINEVLCDFRSTTVPSPDASQDLDGLRSRIVAQREYMIAINRAEINKALENCACKKES